MLDRGIDRDDQVELLDDRHRVGEISDLRAQIYQRRVSPLCADLGLCGTFLQRDQRQTRQLAEQSQNVVERLRSLTCVGGPAQAMPSR
jgi:hypothetical protein